MIKDRASSIVKSNKSMRKALVKCVLVYLVLILLSIVTGVVFVYASGVSRVSPLLFGLIHLVLVIAGFINLKESELLLYRVRDIGLTRTLWQRLFGVGTIHIYSSDTTDEHLDIVSVKKAKDVKDLISSKVEESKKSRRIGTTEIIGSDVTDLECNN